MVIKALFNVYRDGELASGVGILRRQPYSYFWPAGHYSLQAFIPFASISIVGITAIFPS